MGLLEENKELKKQLETKKVKAIDMEDYELLEWNFKEFHKLKTREEAVYKLIEVHKAWNKKVEEAVSI